MRYTALMPLSIVVSLAAGCSLDIAERAKATAKEDDPDGKATDDSGTTKPDGVDDTTDAQNPATEGEQDAGGELAEFGITYPSFVYRAAFKDAELYFTRGEMTFDASDDALIMTGRFQRTSTAPDKASYLKQDGGTTTYTRASKEEVEAAGVTYSAGLFFASGIKVETSKGKTNTYTATKPFPVAIIPAPQSRYATLAASSPTWTTTLTCHYVGSGGVEKTKVTTITTHIAAELGEDTSTLTLTTESDNIADGSMRDFYWFNINIAKEQTATIDHAKRVVTKSSFVRFGPASFEPESYELCKKIVGDEEETFPCPDEFD